MNCIFDENHKSQAGDAERLDEKGFSNGDVYIGSFKGMVPHGKGKYMWADGAVYDGGWEEGKRTGKGQIFWPSGAKYDGDFSGGYLHGFGTFFASDGSIYKGTWRMNICHGLGRKIYPNSDIYEGSWKEGVHEGRGEYSWRNGNTYIGNWKCGKMHSRGVMNWGNGDLYDGFWFNGFRHGSGLYRFASGGYYHGTWTNGVKDGKGTFCPPPSENKLHCDDSEKVLLAQGSSGKFKFHKSSHRRSVPKSLRSLDQMTTLSDVNSNLYHDSSFTFLLSDDEVQDNDHVVYEREYVQGICIKEISRNHGVLPHGTKQPHAQDTTKRSCVSILRGNKSNYSLLLNLQLGISYSIGKITPQLDRNVQTFDFGNRACITMFFPRKGSQFTPPHKSIDFYWKDYCPMVFRGLRELFKLDAAEYMMSICSDDGLRELSSPGKSGSIFYLSHDDKFFIKTLTRSELKFLLKMLPSYYRHVELHENTLITKFFGLHRITLQGGRKVRFVVMGNMFGTELRVHRRYDLKGSTKGRSTGKEKLQQNATLKDLDLSYEFHMDRLLRESLFNQLSQDTQFLEGQGIFDYSLLLGVHFMCPNHLNGPPDAMRNDKNSPDRCEGLRLVEHEPNSVSTAPGPHIRGRSVRARSGGDKEVDLLLPSSERLQVQLGVNMPAQAHRVAEGGCEEEELFEVYDVVLYMGIIDILQEFRMRRRVEHACKSMKSDPVSISIADPKQYATRFISFLQKKVFPPSQS